MSDCTLSRVQSEVAEWAKQFGQNPSHDSRYTDGNGDGIKLFAIPPFLGMVEELGELAAPMVKRHQGRGYQDTQEYCDAVEDALADLLIFMCDFANREGVALAGVLARTWETVKQRQQQTWQQDKDREQSDLAGATAGLEQTGQGFAEPPEETRPKRTGWDVARDLASWLDGREQDRALRYIEQQERLNA